MQYIRPYQHLLRGIVFKADLFFQFHIFNNNTSFNNRICLLGHPRYRGLANHHLMQGCFLNPTWRKVFINISPIMWTPFCSNFHICHRFHQHIKRTFARIIPKQGACFLVNQAKPFKSQCNFSIFEKRTFGNLASEIYRWLWKWCKFWAPLPAADLSANTFIEWKSIKAL